MDVEEISRRHLAAGTPDDDIVRLLSRDILTIKRNRISPAYAEEFARAVLAEAKNSTDLSGDLFTFEPSGSTMGEFGVGSRGSGDFFAHRQLARIIGRTSAAVGVDEMDDAGAVRAAGEYIITTVDGMHSRLSDFPFVARVTWNPGDAPRRLRDGGKTRRPPLRYPRRRDRKSTRLNSSHWHVSRMPSSA